MGIIQKQSIRSSIFIILGFAIGAFNILVLFPKFLTPEQFGLTRAMLDISVTLSVLCTVGSIGVINKFSPFYNYYLKDKKNDLPFITAIVCLIGFGVIMLCGYLFKDFIIRKLGKSPDLAIYFYTIYPFTFLMLLFSWLEAFTWTLKKTVITNFLRETVVRVFGTFIVLLYAFHLVSFKGLIHLFSLSFLIPALILLMVLLKSGHWRFSITSFSSVTFRLKGRMAGFGLFIFGSQFLNLLAKTNDTFMIFGIQGLAETAVYSVATYMVTVMDIPARSMNSISVPVLAEAWKNNDLNKIENIYKKSVANLMVVGLGLFGLIFLNIENLSTFLGKNYEQVTLIVFITGMAKVIDLGTGINSIIIGTSNYWKFDFYTNVLYTLLSIPLNFFLIKAFGLKGLAFSALISTILYNAVRFVFLYRKFGLQPYTVRILLVLIIALGIYFIVYLIPYQNNIFLDSFIRSALFIILFFPVMYKSNIAPDLNAIAVSTLKRLRNKNNE